MSAAKSILNPMHLLFRLRENRSYLNTFYALFINACSKNIAREKKFVFSLRFLYS